MEKSPFISLGDFIELNNLYSLINEDNELRLSEKNSARVRKGRSLLDKFIDEKKPIYGVTTGFGVLENTWISESDQNKLQENLIKSHAIGMGDFIPKNITKTAILLLANSLAKGHSGIKLSTLQTIMDYFNLDLIPKSYKYGSLGASGDLAPLAHLVSSFMGHGKFWNQNNQPAKNDKVNHIELTAKEGLALINGTHFMASYALHICQRSLNLIWHSLIASAISLEAIRGTSTPFRNEFWQYRKHSGHRIISLAIAEILQGSQILESHKDYESDHKVQDPYSFRCIPQVMGAIWDAFRYLEQTLAVEVNSITDNPLLVLGSEEVISGGNFHGEPLALPLEAISLALVEIANITEARISRIINPHVSQLPAFLADKPGLESGVMILHYTVASLVNRMRTLSHPSVVDNIPVSGFQEDHVSMGMNSASKAFEILELCEEVVSSELYISIRAFLLSKNDLNSSTLIENIVTKVAKKIKIEEKDHFMKPELDLLVDMLRNGTLKQKLDGGGTVIPNRFS